MYSEVQRLCFKMKMGLRLLTWLIVLCLLNGVAYSQISSSDLPEITTHPGGGTYAPGSNPITLTCEATGSTTIQWTHNNVLLPSNDPRISSATTLTISSLTAELSGRYVCIASNDAGSVASVEAVVTLAELNAMFLSSDPTNPHMVSTPPGQPLTLSCGPYTTIPHVAAEWEIYDSSGNIQIDPSFDMAVVGLSGSLYLQNPVHPLNTQIYQCEVSNSLLRRVDLGFVQVTVLDDSSTTPAPPQIIVPPGDTTVNLGDSAFFECIVGGSPIPSVQWDCPACGTSRVRFLQGGAILRVSSIMPSDVGAYTCTVGEGLGSISASLTIRTAPSLTTLLPQTPVEVIYGSPISLSCGASGEDITWQWYHNGSRLEQFSDSSIEVLSSGEEDAGTYQCYAYSPAGFQASAAIVNVTTLAASISSQLPPSQLVFRSEPFQVSCMATGAPPPTFRWFKGDVPLSDSGTFDLSEPNVLRIPSVEDANSGSYTCMAVNTIGEREIGRDISSTMLTIIAPTVITRQHDTVFTAQEDTPTTLYCEVEYDQRASLGFSWTKDGVSLVMDDRVMFEDPAGGSGNVRIEGVRREDAGVYVCSVTTTYQDLTGPVQTTNPTNFSVIATPVAPQILGLSSPSSTSLEVVWGFTGMTDLLQIYSIEFQLTASPEEEWKSVTSNVHSTTRITIEDLQPATQYNVRVVAMYNAGLSISSDVRSKVTQDGAPSGSPTGVKISVPSNEQICILLQPPSQPNGEVTNYTVEYRLKDEEEFTTLTVPGSETKIIIDNLMPLERYMIRIAAVTSGGQGPFSETFEVVTVKEGGLEEPSSPPHQQIWFIVVMVVIALLLVTAVVVLILVIRYRVYRKKSRKYHVRRPTSGYFSGGGVEDVNLSEDAAQDYLGRSKRSDREGSSVFESPDMYLERESAISAPSYTTTPQLSTGSGVRLVGHPAPDYINPPSFEEAIKSHPRTHSAASHRSSTGDKVFADWDTEEKVSALMSEDGVKTHDIFTNGHIGYDYDSDSIEKPAYSESLTTEGTEYSHLQGVGGSPQQYSVNPPHPVSPPYNHLNVNPPPESVEFATLV